MEQHIMVKMVLDHWLSTVAKTDKLINQLTNEQLMEEASPGRNRGIYLLGHLAAVHDKMLPLLGLGPQRYTGLDEVFLISPDKSGREMPPVDTLRAHWKEANEELARHFSDLQPHEWFQRHTSVSEEDFAKEPHRNRLNVLMSRTIHLSEHWGQLLFLKK